MIKKTIPYTDFNGEEVKEDFYFNLSRAELLDLETSMPGGITGLLQTIGESDDGKVVYPRLKTLVSVAVGQKSSDGRRFLKNDDIRSNFFDSDAFSVMVFGWFKDISSLTEFIAGIMPANLEEFADEVQAALLRAQNSPADNIPQNPTTTSKVVDGEILSHTAQPTQDPTPWLTEKRAPTPAEYTRMTPAQVQEAFAARGDRQDSQ